MNQDCLCSVLPLEASGGSTLYCANMCCVCVSPAEFTTPRAILTGHDCEVTCASVCAELGVVISGCKGEILKSKVLLHNKDPVQTRFRPGSDLVFTSDLSDGIKTGTFRSEQIGSELRSLMLCCLFAEGPCLIHSMNGDLLRTLEVPERCMRPRLIQSSTEGHCMIYYDKGQFCLFSVNGKLLGHMEVEDSIKVRGRIVLQCENMCVCRKSKKVLSLIKAVLTEI